MKRRRIAVAGLRDPGSVRCVRRSPVCRWRPVRAGALSAAALAGALVAAVPAQPPPVEPFLLDLPGAVTAVRYAPGSLDRAVRAQARFESLAREVAKLGGPKAVLAVYVLPREDWERLGIGRPYGLPAPMGAAGIALAAAGDSGTIALWRQWLGGSLPAVAGTPLLSSPEEAASLAVHDLIAEAEAARVLLAGAAITGDAPWVGDVAAHLLALAAFTRHEPARLPEITGVFASLARAGAGPGALAAMTGSASASPQEWLAAQGHCFAGALALASGEPRRAARQLFDLAAKGGGRLAAAELRERFPGFDRWLDGMARHDR